MIVGNVRQKNLNVWKNKERKDRREEGRDGGRERKDKRMRMKDGGRQRGTEKTCPFFK